MEEPFLSSCQRVDGVHLQPSVLPLPQLLSDQELQACRKKLRKKASEGFESQLRALRTELFGKVLYATQVAQIVDAVQVSCRGLVLQELYERQFIIKGPPGEPTFADALADAGAMGVGMHEAATLRAQVEATAQQALSFLPEVLEAPPGLAVGVLPFAPPADSANLTPCAPAPGMQQGLLLMHFNGPIVTLVGDPATMSVRDILGVGSQQFGVRPFDSSRHYALLVWPSHIILSDLVSPIGELGIPHWARILWLEMPMLPARCAEKPVDPRTAGLRFVQVMSTFFAISLSGRLQISKGELRNFLWNLNLDDASFAQLWERVDSRNRGFLDIDDLLHLVGRAHLLHPTVPVDALLYEAAVLITRSPSDARQNGKHFTPHVADAPHGVGAGGACEHHGLSYFCSFLLGGAVPVCIVFYIYLSYTHCSLSDEWCDDPMPAFKLVFLLIAGFAYVCYLFQSLCMTNFPPGDRITGLENVCNVMETPKSDVLHFIWNIQCYHHETRTVTETYRDEDGNMQTWNVAKTIRVDTSQNSITGTIPSVDDTPVFIPDTTALLTEIDTELRLDFEQSDYLQCFAHWCRSNRFDTDSDETRFEWLPSRKKVILAEWVSGVTPCWLRRDVYSLATMLLFSGCVRWYVQSRCGHQHFTYVRRCFRIEYMPPSRCHQGAAALLGGSTAL